jgi:hypothetical protein
MAEPARREQAHSVVWRPHAGPQSAFLTCPVFEVFFGGARGGGKTSSVLGEFGVHAGRYGSAAVGLMVRRERTQLIETIEAAKLIYLPLGARYKETDKLFEFPNGARLRMAYLERDADAEAYQGHEYTRVYVEEIGNFPDPAPIKKMFATLRSRTGVPVGFRATGNPGGPGHTWVRARYIDPAPMGYRVITDDVTGLQRVYIPSRIADNPTLTTNDPGYVNRLRASGSPELVRAWLEGDWSVIAGAYFPEFSIDRHVVAPRTLPKDWVRFRAMDWGSYRPSCVLWIALSDGSLPEFPRGALVVYRELYTASEPNVGLKLTADEMAERIIDAERGEKIDYGVLDPAAWKQEGGPSVAERFAGKRVNFMKADNARLVGWDQVRARLKGEEAPMLYVFATCTNLIRTLPALQHDEHKPEDVDSDGEDHAGDALRYGCMSRPYARPEPAPRTKGDVYSFDGKGGLVSNLTWREMMERRERRARADE